jgi:16S rRNA C967 or C1407 C5-methylase (RsmB/RsmF family)
MGEGERGERRGEGERRQGEDLQYCRFVKVVETGLEFGREGFTRYRFSPSLFSLSLTGFCRGKEFHPSLKLARRYYPHAHNIDGFFVCKLHKVYHPFLFY